MCILGFCVLKLLGHFLLLGGNLGEVLFGILKKGVLPSFRIMTQFQTKLATLTWFLNFFFKQLLSVSNSNQIQTFGASH